MPILWGGFMVRAMVAFLIGLPLLMPPGMCICQFVPDARAAEPEPTEVSCQEEQDAHAEEPCTVPPRKCSCACHRPPKAEPVANTSIVSITSLRSAADEPKVPDDSRHVPGCPALRSVDNSKVAETHRPLLDRVDAVPEFLRLVLFMAIATARVEVHRPEAAGSPLYLSQCSLLI